MSAIQIDNENAICEVTNIHFCNFTNWKSRHFAQFRGQITAYHNFSGTILHGKDSNNILFWM